MIAGKGGGVQNGMAALNKLLNKETTSPTKVEFVRMRGRPKKTQPPKISEVKKVIETDEVDNSQDVGNGKDDKIELFELKNLFGDGFNEKEYREMYKRFVSFQVNYPLRTVMHKEALITYVKYAFKRDQSISNDDIEAADKWGKLAAKQATDAKINPSQLSATDLSDGISNFGKVVEAVEKAVDIIPLLPRWLQDPQDGLDYYIWQQTQYLRRLENKPLTKYSDLYAFMGEQYEKYKSKYNFIAREEDGHHDDNKGDL